MCRQTASLPVNGRDALPLGINSYRKNPAGFSFSAGRSFLLKDLLEFILVLFQCLTVQVFPIHRNGINL